VDDARKSTWVWAKKLAERIMQMDYPKAIKRAGRTILTFDQSFWNRYSFDIVHKGNTKKFAQNLELFMAFRAIVGTTLVEASLYDRVWGCGCYATKPVAQQRETWNGLNLLGKIFT